jgi:hypothetical protein
MHEYSCYGYNVGQLTLSNGKVVAVCFTDESIEVGCARIRVKGKYVTKTIDSNGSSPCPAGTLTYFEASSYTCK